MNRIVSVLVGGDNSASYEGAHWIGFLFDSELGVELGFCLWFATRFPLCEPVGILSEEDDI